MNLGLLYLKGRGLAQDLSEALRLLSQAADDGNSKAFVGLAYMYHLGQGVKRDDAIAYSWLQLAKERGQPEADSIQIATDGLSQSQIEEAHLRTENWKAAHAGQNPIDLIPQK